MSDDAAARFKRSGGKRWLLPDGVEEMLPPDAEAIERLRRRILDRFSNWGYELVIPPPLEYLDSLLTGFGSDLDLQTFKVVDQKTGRLMGLRADVTSQTARIDAHVLQRDSVTRLCYAETVLHARANDAAESRCPILVGAEIYGAANHSADAEIISLMAETLECAGLDECVIEIGHVGVLRALARVGGLDTGVSDALFQALQRKSSADVRELIASVDVDANLRSAIESLVDLNGDAESVLRGADALVKRLSAPLSREVDASLAEVREVLRWVNFLRPSLRVRLDLAELRGFAYHTGLVFAAYHPGFGQAVARGGRYDGIGTAFGRHRPATGFDADLKSLVAGGRLANAVVDAIAAPLDTNESVERSAALRSKVAQLRANGERVVWQLPGGAAHSPCKRRLVWRADAWVVDDR